MVEPLWTPSAARREAAALTHFMRRAEQRCGSPITTYDALHAWSISDPAAFWGLVWEQAEVVHSAAPSQVMQGSGMPGTTWFPGARLNFAENLLRRRGEAIALLAADERGGPALSVSYDELRARVASFQRFLQRQGVGAGDRVAAWMPNRIEAVIAMLATAGLGAIFSSSSPDFGIKGVLDRFGQIEPKVLLASDGAWYGGKAHPSLDRLSEVVAALGDGLRSVVVVPVLGTTGALQGLPKAVWWDEAQEPGDDEPHFEQLPFDHPLYILYSSGTTGVPKCIVHGAGGTLLQHAKEHLLHTDIGPDDVVFYFTTTGWMMWNWLVSALFTGATVVLWDGSPVHPSVDALWQLAEDHHITVFGTSPKYLALCAKEGLRPGEQHDLTALRTVLSTGSPLPIEGFHWVYDAVSADVQLASICGGTDLISCFMLGSPIDPVHPGEIQKRGLGMAVEAWRAPHTPVTGERAELVCVKPFPSMPVGFWRDPDGSRYRRAYFEHFPGVWHHGDYIELTERGGVVVHGRSDATLNPGGVRIGTAEIYRPVEAMEEVLDALVVGLPKDDDVEVVLFVVLAPGLTLDAGLERTIRRNIREVASPRHVPARIHQVPGVPRTISGKKVEIAVAQVLRGEQAPNRDALANPEALDWFAAHAPTLG
jgi:acetoacetyl-CoA synthetase